MFKLASPLLLVSALLLLNGCDSNFRNVHFKNYHDKESSKIFAAKQHVEEKNKDAFIVDTGNAVYLILPNLIPQNLDDENDHLWYELSLRKIGSHALVHVRLEMDELKKDKIIYSTHIINQKSDHEVFTQTLCNDHSIIVRLDDPHFYNNIFKAFDGQLDLKLYHNLKAIKFGKFYELDSNQLKDAVFEH